MAKKKAKTANREIQKHNPPREKMIPAHDKLYSEEIAPRIRRFNTALANQDYETSQKLWEEIEELRKEWKILKDRRVYVPRSSIGGQ